jgi:uncharacterized membrane protein YdcZ (DUF606 family)
MGNFAIYVLIVFAGVFQAFGNPMNSQLKASLQNPWLAATISFALIVPVFLMLFSIQPQACCSRWMFANAGASFMT